jgi:hypothetical protein
MQFDGNPLTPAEDSAYILRRVAALLLVFAMPLSALVSRRSFNILLPFSVVLLTFAFFLDMKKQEVTLRLVRFFSKPMAYVLCGFLAWLVLSLPWASFYSETWSKVFSLTATLIFPMLGVLVLPDRIPESLVFNIGFSLGLLGGCAILTDVAQPFLESEETVSRVFLVLSLFVWSGCACFFLLEKSLYAAGLFLVIALSILGGTFEAPKILLAVGIFSVSLLYFIPVQSLMRISLYGMLGCIFLTPLVLILFSGITFILGSFAKHPIFLEMMSWKTLLFEQPFTLLAGHGLGAWNHVHTLRGLPNTFSSTFFVTLWYELGLVGAVAHGLILWSVLRTIREIPNEILRGAALVTFYVVLVYTYVWSVADKLWWAAILGALVLAFVAIGRLQNVTTSLRINFVPQE